jgi:predicted esterase
MKRLRREGAVHHGCSDIAQAFFFVVTICFTLCCSGDLAFAYLATLQPQRPPDRSPLTTQSAPLLCGQMVTGNARTQEIMLDGVPAIIRIPSIVSRPPVILWHGFGPPASPSALSRALPLDDVPAIKVYPWLPLFGPRAPPGGADEVSQRQTEDYVRLLFEASVLKGASELPGIIRALIAQGCMRESDPIGLFGFSAGGAAVLNVLAEKQVRVVDAVTVNAPVNLNATMAALERATTHAYRWTPESRNIARRADALQHAAAIAGGNPPPRLLVIHGKNDSVIPSQGAVALEHALRPYYHARHFDTRLELSIEPGVSHLWTDSAVLKPLQVQIADWFNMSSETR